MRSLRCQLDQLFQGIISQMYRIRYCMVNSLVCGIGELDVGVSSKPPPSPRQESSLPYLLLDVRDKECYDQCHIIGGDLMN